MFGGVTLPAIPTDEERRKRIERRVRLKHNIGPAVLCGIGMGLWTLSYEASELSRTEAYLKTIYMTVGCAGLWLWLHVYWTARPTWMKKSYNEGRIRSEIATLEQIEGLPPRDVPEDVK